jgi:hypothetical protein
VPDGLSDIGFGPPGQALGGGRRPPGPGGWPADSTLVFRAAGAPSPAGAPPWNPARIPDQAGGPDGPGADPDGQRGQAGGGPGRAVLAWPELAIPLPRRGWLRRRRPARRPPRRKLRQRRGVQVLAGLLAVVVGVTGWSAGGALTRPGGGTTAERLAEWARDHHLGPAVTFGEWLTYSPPKVGGQPSFALTGPAAGIAPGRATRHHHQHSAAAGRPHRLKSPAGKPVKGEGNWRVLASAHGHAAIYGTYLRPDSVHTSYVSGIVSMDPRLLRFQLHPGAEDPGPGNWRSAATIAPADRRGLLATFNGGFKIATSDGGFYLNGDRRGTLTPGVASVVYYKDGRIAIGDWGRGRLRMSRRVAGVRQNLHLIVAHGRVPAAVDRDVVTSWGATLGGGYYVWRSGLGVTKSGRVIFVYGPALDVHTLAGLLRRAGAVTAMQLDINPDWMSYMYYLPRHHPRDPTPVNLLPDQLQPAGRYYGIANRDFTAVYAR